jgi:carbon monoxide dehydrogenase subunit G
VNLEGTRSFAAPRETVWEVLNDPAQMAGLMPGVESFDVQDDRHWSASVKIPLGLGGLKMKINFEKTEERAPEFARLVAKGQGVGAMLNMATSFELGEAASGGTEMHWSADVAIAGPVGSMGQRVLQPIVNQQVTNVLNALDTQIQQAAAGGAESGAQVGQSGEVFIGSTPNSEATGPSLPGGEAEAGAGDTGASVAPSEGSLGTQEPTTEIEPPQTDPEPKDAGPPAESSPTTEPEEGTSGAEEGLNPWAPQAYDETGEGPTTSTEG